MGCGSASGGQGRAFTGSSAASMSRATARCAGLSALNRSSVAIIVQAPMLPKFLALPRQSAGACNQLHRARRSTTRWADRRLHPLDAWLAEVCPPLPKLSGIEAGFQQRGSDGEAAQCGIVDGIEWNFEAEAPGLRDATCFDGLVQALAGGGENWVRFVILIFEGEAQQVSGLAEPGADVADRRSPRGDPVGGELICFLVDRGAG